MTSDEWIRSGDWQEVKSTNVKAYRYLRRERMLQVQFLGTAKKIREPVYKVHDVTDMVARTFFLVDSKGKFYARYIKDSYHVTGPFHSLLRTLAIDTHKLFEQEDF